MRKICIIPARAGSKRIPGKNIKHFLGKPVIAYSIAAARQSRMFDEIMVSTDDKVIADIALEYGATVPFMRSEKNANDYATTAEVLSEVLAEYQSRNQRYDYACCLYPAAPLVSANALSEAFSEMIAKDLDSIFPVVRYCTPILRSLKFTDGKVSMNWPEHKFARSQDLGDAYHDSGQFYWFNIERYLLTQEIMTDNCGAIEISAIQSQDIDNESDWKLAELKYQLLWPSPAPSKPD